MLPATRSQAQLFFWYVNLQVRELVLHQVGSSVRRSLSFIVLLPFLVGPSNTVSFAAWPLPFSRLGSHRCPSRSLFFSRLARFVDRLFERPSSIRLVASWPAFCTPGFLVLPLGQAVGTSVFLPLLPWHSRFWRCCLGPVLPPSFDCLFRRPRFLPPGRPLVGSLHAWFLLPWPLLAGWQYTVLFTALYLTFLRGSLWPFLTMASSAGRLLDPFWSWFFIAPRFASRRWRLYVLSHRGTLSLLFPVQSSGCFLFFSVPPETCPLCGSYILGPLARLAFCASGHGHHVYFHHPRGPFGSRKLGTLLTTDWW